MQGPIAVSEIITTVGSQADRVSVYRTLHMFEELGIAHRIYFGWKYKYELSEIFTEHHHHISCIACGMVVDISDETHLEKFITSEANKAGFTVKRHLFEIEGLCSECTSKEHKA